MSNIRADGYQLSDPDDNEAFQILIGDVKRMKQQLAGLSGTINPSGVGQPTAAINAAQVSSMISGAMYPYGFGANVPFVSGPFLGATTADIPYTITNWDTTGGAWTGTQFTAPTNGLYLITLTGVCFYNAGAAPDIYLYVYKGAGTVLAKANQAVSSAAGNPTVSDTVVVISQLNTGDVVKSAYSNNSVTAGALYVDFCILRLGANP